MPAVALGDTLMEPVRTRRKKPEHRSAARFSREERMDSLYEAVLELAEEGRPFSQITVADIADRAGIGKGTVYEYFGTKEEIIASAVLYGMKHLRATMTRFMEKHEGFAERLEFVFDLITKGDREMKLMLRLPELLWLQSDLYTALLRHKAGEQRSIYEACAPEQTLKRLAEEAMERGEIARAPLSYVITAIVSRLGALSLYVRAGRGELEFWTGKDPVKDSFPAETMDLKEEEMRELLLQGLLRELRKR